MAQVLPVLPVGPGQILHLGAQIRYSLLCLLSMLVRGLFLGGELVELRRKFAFTCQKRIGYSRGVPNHEFAVLMKMIQPHQVGQRNPE